MIASSVRPPPQPRKPSGAHTPQSRITSSEPSRVRDLDLDGAGGHGERRRRRSHRRRRGRRPRSASSTAQRRRRRRRHVAERIRLAGRSTRPTRSTAASRELRHSATAAGALLLAVVVVVVAGLGRELGRGGAARLECAPCSGVIMNFLTTQRERGGHAAPHVGRDDAGVHRVGRDAGALERRASSFVNSTFDSFETAYSRDAGEQRVGARSASQSMPSAW